MKIKKRDGRLVAFDQNKIIDAVLAAFKEVDGELTDYAYIKAGNIADYILDYCKEYKQKQIEINSTDCYLDIESIQDLVEKGLMATKRKDVAKAYMLYRENRNRIRNKNNELMKNIGDKLFTKNIENQNANVDEHSFGGRKGEAANVLFKDYALNYIISPMARENHLNNMIYIHDLSDYQVGEHNCLSIPYDDLLAKGFNTRQTDVRPANSINTAFQLVAVIAQLQSLQQFGGVSATHLDWTMVPYVRKSFLKHYKDGLHFIIHIDTIPDISDQTSIENREIYNNKEAYDYAQEMTRREAYQGAEGLLHNLNTLQSRSGNFNNWFPFV